MGGVGVLERRARWGSALKLTAILVHYHTPELAGDAVEALARDAGTSGIDLELLIVDNGASEAGRARLESLPARLVDSTGNLGYAGGVNRGIEDATGDAFVILNPDVSVCDGCLTGLVDALESGASVAGPRFFLDEARNWLQPPAEERTVMAEMRQILASAGIGTSGARRRWRSRAHRFWSAEKPRALPELSGALLAIRRDAWNAAGPMDTGFKLYFEETDWLLRLSKMGGDIRFVPGARAVHLWAQSTQHEPKSAAWFETSARRFRRRWYGGPGCRLLESVAGLTASRRRRFAARTRSSTRPNLEGAAWLELSRDATGFPAAGHRLGASPALVPPPAHLAKADLDLRAVDADGRDL